MMYSRASNQSSDLNPSISKTPMAPRATSHPIIENNHTETIQGLTITVLLGFYFTLLQVIEYLEASFSISDSVYGSTFFVATGFHGLHVIIGTIFLLVILARQFSGHFSKDHHLGIVAAI